MFSMEKFSGGWMILYNTPNKGSNMEKHGAKLKLVFTWSSSVPVYVENSIRLLS